MDLPLEECRAWIYICRGNFWSAFSSSVSKWYLSIVNFFDVQAMWDSCTCDDVAEAWTCISLWKRYVIEMATCIGFLHLRRFRKYSQSTFFSVHVFSSLVVLVFWAGNRHTDFVIFFSYFVMIFHHILFMRKRQISFSPEISYPRVMCSTPYESIVSGE